MRMLKLSLSIIQSSTLLRLNSREWTSNYKCSNKWWWWDRDSRYSMPCKHRWPWEWTSLCQCQYTRISLLLCQCTKDQLPTTQLQCKEASWTPHQLYRIHRWWSNSQCISNHTCNSQYISNNKCINSPVRTNTWSNSPCRICRWTLISNKWWCNSSRDDLSIIDYIFY